MPSSEPGTFEVCPGCGIQLAPTSAPTHPYIGASPSCWALYGEVLAREYSDPAYMIVHRLTVDAYAAQHPGQPERRSTQSVWLHLAGLYLTLEKNLPPALVRRLMEAMTGAPDELYWLDPPGGYEMSIADVVDSGSAQTHRQLIRRWATAVWDAWRIHQAAVRTTVDQRLARL